MNPGLEANDGPGPLLWAPVPPAPEPPPVPPPGTVDVLAFPLDSGERTLSRAISLLSPEERARAERFASPRLRDRYVIGQATQRTVLAVCTGIEADRLRFDYGPHGKPELHQRETGFEFNLSHSGGLGVLAVGRGFPPIGVDVERTGRTADLEALARRCFIGQEYVGFRGLRGSDRVLGFFLGWTRKEAFMKATGEGLARPLNSFEVEVRPGAEPRFLRLPEGEDPAAWTLEHLVPARGFVGALAVRSSGKPVRVRTWSWVREPV